MLRVAWQGKPVFVVNRTPEALASIEAQNDRVRDPHSEKDQQPEYARNPYRSRAEDHPEILVLVGLCTHLGCSPQFVSAHVNHALGSDWQGGFFCPCHGSKFDNSGRVFQGVPAPDNLVVPKYQFLSDTVLLIGEDQRGAA